MRLPHFPCGRRMFISFYAVFRLSYRFYGSLHGLFGYNELFPHSGFGQLLLNLRSLTCFRKYGKLLKIY